MDRDGRADRLLEHTRAFQEDMRNLRNDMAEVGRDLRRRTDLSKVVREHPFRTVLIAAGAGYVLGGGLFSSFTRQLLRAGGRAMVVPLLRRQLESMLTGRTAESD